MVIKKIAKRNSATGLTSVVIMILIVIGIYFGSYLYFTENVASSGVGLNDTTEYAETYSRLNATQQELDANVQEVQGNFEIWWKRIARFKSHGMV